MVDFTGVAAVGSSLRRYLAFRFSEQQPVATSDTSVVLARTEDLNAEEDPLINPPCLSLFLYRVDVNKTMRASWSSEANARGMALLPLDFHFLFIPWGDDAEQEHRIIGRTLQCLEDTPILSGPFLDPVTNWREGESIQVCIEELPTEDIMRTFDSLPIDYKLCIPYVARILVLEGRRVLPDPEAVRLDLRLHAGTGS